MLFLNSCASTTSSPAIESTQPATVPASSATFATTTANVFHVEKIDYKLPDQIAEGIVIESTPESISAITNEPIPKHITMKLVNYSTESQFIAVLSIYLLDDVFEKPRRDALQNIINNETSPQDYMDSINLFAAEDIKVRPQKLEFQNGSGVSYLYYWGVGPGIPVSNDRLVYQFDGITNNGRYYVTAQLPVNVPFLPDSIDLSSSEFVSPPSGAVPYPDFNDTNSIIEYDNTLRAQFREAAANTFTPSLEDLNAFIQSLLILIKE